ncbi:MAG: anaerobic ribonucleoside-triphosphate reductase activating protein [Ignavibacteriales bacterium]
MKVGGFQKISTVDYPGYLASTIFLSGCNLKCKYCHNPSLANGEIVDEQTGTEEILSFLKKRKGLIDAVCISGGEPTIHEDLEELICSIKEMGFKVKLDTNGTNPYVVKNLIDKRLIDYVAVDIKATIDKYHEVAGCFVNTDKIKETIKLLINSNIDYEFRTTLLPDLNQRDIKEIAGYVEGSSKYVIQQFRNKVTLNEDYSSKMPYKSEILTEMSNNIKHMFKQCEIRGV